MGKTQTYTVKLKQVVETSHAVFGGHVAFRLPDEKEDTYIYMRPSLKGAKPGDTMQITMDEEIGVRSAKIVKHRTLTWFLTLLTLLFLTALACTSPMVVLTSTPTSFPTQTPNAPKPVRNTPNALVAARVIAIEALHVRNEPLGIVIGYLYNADTVTLTNACQNGWAQIKWQGATAWVNARFLSDNKCQTSEEE